MSSYLLTKSVCAKFYQDQSLCFTSTLTKVYWVGIWSLQNLVLIAWYEPCMKFKSLTNWINQHFLPFIRVTDKGKFQQSLVFTKFSNIKSFFSLEKIRILQKECSKIFFFIKCTWSGRRTWGRTPVWSLLGVSISIFCLFDKFESRRKFLLQVVQPTFKKIWSSDDLIVVLLSHVISNYLGVHAHCQVVWQIKPEVTSWSWTLIQVRLSITGLEKVIARIFYPLVSFLVDIVSLHKPHSCSNHVILLKQVETSHVWADLYKVKSYSKHLCVSIMLKRSNESHQA